MLSFQCTNLHFGGNTSLITVSSTQWQFPLVIFYIQCQFRIIQGLGMVITASVDSLAPNDAKPSIGRILAEKLRQFSLKVLRLPMMPYHLFGPDYIIQNRRRSRVISRWRLTHWGRVTHICVSKLTIISSDNGLSPRRRQAIIWTNAGILLIGRLGTNFSEILVGIQTFSFRKMHLKMSSAL